MVVGLVHGVRPLDARILYDWVRVMFRWLRFLAIFLIWVGVFFASICAAVVQPEVVSSRAKELSSDAPTRLKKRLDVTSKIAPSNIGFMKNPPRELQKKFSMCDEFLDVEWINREKMIGYSRYEIDVKGEKKMLWSLVYLNDLYPRYNIDLYTFKQSDQLRKVFEFVKNGRDISNNPAWLIMEYKGENITFYGGGGGTYSPSLTDNRQTVCITYPDNERVWIVEGKSVKQVYSEQERDVLSKKIEETGGKFSRERLESLWVLDVNFDGENDFILEQSLAYYWSEQVYQLKRIVEITKYRLLFPPINRECHIEIDGIYPLTTDGKNYYISNQCNITELTSMTGEK